MNSQAIQYIKRGALLGFLAGAGIDLYQQYQQQQQDTNTFQWKRVDWRSMIKMAALLALLGAVVGWLIHWLTNDKSVEKANFSESDFLEKVLADQQVAGSAAKTSALLNQITDVARSEWSQYLAMAPVLLGSVIDRTAILGSDLDVMTVFKKDSFKTLGSMFRFVHDSCQHHLNEKYYSVRAQKRSIGVTDRRTGEHVDVVPARKLSFALADQNVKLFVNPERNEGIATSIKTNPQIHRRLVVNRPFERKIVRLVRTYARINDIPLTNIIVKNMVVKAANSGYIVSRSLKEALVETLHYIAEHVTDEVLLDKANSNNNLLSKFSPKEKQRISDQLRKDALAIAENSMHLKNIYDA